MASMTSPKVCLLFVVLSSQTSLAAEPGKDQRQAVPSEPSVLHTVVDAIRANYRNLPPVACVIKSTSLNRGVKERTVVRGNAIKDGQIIGGFVYVEEPQVTTFAKILIAGRSLRVDSRRISTGEEWFETFHNGRYTSVIPDKKWASIHYFRDMPGLVNRDPRNVGSIEHKHDFPTRLSECRLARHETKMTPAGQRLVLHLERHIPEYKVTTKWDCEVDPRRSYLPCRIVDYVSLDPKNGGKINLVLDVEYQELPGKKVWFLKNSTVRYYHPEYADSPDQNGWRHQTTDEVRDQIQVLDKVDAKRFEIEIPKGIELRDNTIGRQPPKKEGA